MKYNIEASFLFVTYNRCPFDDFEKNPLTWAFQTLLSNNYVNRITEWVVVNDGSIDNTIENLNWISEKYKINIKIIENKRNKGCSFSRARGIESLANDLFFMGDDDCLFGSDFVELALKNWQKIKINDEKIAVLAFPVFEMRKSFFSKTYKENIGSVNHKQAWFCHNFDNGLITNDEYFKIKTFSGITLGSRESFLKAGNFPDLSFWENDYSEHIEVSYLLEKKGYTMYFLPNNEVGVTHVKWGSSRNELIPSDERKYIFKGIKYSLDEISFFSSTALESGCRINYRDFLINRIGSFLSFYLKVSFDSALSYAVMEYESAVNNNYIKGTPSLSKLKDGDKILILESFAA